LTAICIACSSQSEQRNERQVDTTLPEVEATHKDISSIEGSDIPIRKGPGVEYGKLINQKATSALGRTEYCEVDYSVKVEVLESQGKWKKVQVVEPEWLSDSHIGWIPSKYVLSKEDVDKQKHEAFSASEYEVLETKHNATVENFHVLLNRKGLSEKTLHDFVDQFRSTHCKRSCNINVYDSKAIVPLIGVYPLNRKQYLKMADHYLSMSTFDAPEVRDWYPYQDFQYKEYGGSNWKKKPIE
jgi:hypothetical protein